MPTLPPEWMVVGLGNPGPEYRGTRHNVGFHVVDELAERHRIKLDKAKHRARFGIGSIGDTPVILVKPMTFMNLSGQAVAPLAREYGLKPDRILVVADDLDMQLGRVRLKPKGSAGGHNGHKSLIQSLGTEEYPRLKIGIGSVDRSHTIDHVLSTFKGDERDVIAIALDRAADGVEKAVQDGLEPGMNVVNQTG
ncbi:aminoacyl-tRNA hydrolase [Fimbriimonas ginsengisoli]|uniref:Peptidyl-tRNA hydrolase n=1 Tax=Fimbriimonas ginsengisoli Gsoil 348 TaxID=661478 RepID=A0A068NSG2_FIMGI|nr:aminoacyl-tRNA hydrolase [Fimbriimonas ginsengisoli]AIE86381.1 peptidyl-tRNA hydrolase [Fimbriimonas ginsengisoli Gsoil 348]